MAFIKITTTGTDPDAVFDIAVPIVAVGISDTTASIAEVSAGTVTIEIASGSGLVTSTLEAAVQAQFTTAIDEAVGDPYAIPVISDITVTSDEYLAPATTVAIVDYTA